MGLGAGDGDDAGADLVDGFADAVCADGHHAAEQESPAGGDVDVGVVAEIDAAGNGLRAGGLDVDGGVAGGDVHGEAEESGGVVEELVAQRLVEIDRAHRDGGGDGDDAAGAGLAQEIGDGVEIVGNGAQPVTAG